MLNGPILVVEDVPNVLELLEITLRFKGYQVVSAHNGVEGLEMIEKSRPALVITDILMPRMDGYAFIQRIRTSGTEWSQIPVIFLSATYITPEDKNFAMSLGATCFIEKPIEMESFLLTIGKIIAEESPSPLTYLNNQDFYIGYRERLEQKLRHKNTQIARAESLLPNLPEEQKPAFQSMLQTAENDRKDIKNELQEVYRALDNFNKSG